MNHADGWMVLDPMKAMTEGGVVLLDNCAAGLHHTAQEDFWGQVVSIAKQNRLSVIATTYSWDVITGFAAAVGDTPDSDSRYIRLESDGARGSVVEYSPMSWRYASSRA